MRGLNNRMIQILQLERSILSKKNSSKKSGATRRRVRKPATQVVHPYLDAITNPFSLPSVGVPNSESLPSHISQGKIVKVFNVTAGQSIFLFCIPSAGNDVNQLFSITGPAADIGTSSFTTVSAGASLGGYAATTLPFSTGTLESTHTTFRGITAGLRITYAGTLLNRGGVMTVYNAVNRGGLYEDMNDATIISGVLTGAASKHHTRYEPVDADPIELVIPLNIGRSSALLTENSSDPQSWNAITDYASVHEADLHRTSERVTIDGASRNLPCSFIYYTNPASSDAQFKVEYYVNCEYHGGVVTSMQVERKPDVQATAAINSVVASATMGHHNLPRTAFRSVVSSFMKRGEKAVTNEVKKDGPKLAAAGLRAGMLALMA